MSVTGLASDQTFRERCVEFSWVCLSYSVYSIDSVKREICKSLSHQIISTFVCDDSIQLQFVINYARPNLYLVDYLLIRLNYFQIKIVFQLIFFIKEYAIEVIKMNWAVWTFNGFLNIGRRKGILFVTETLSNRQTKPIILINI